MTTNSIGPSTRARTVFVALSLLTLATVRASSASDVGAGCGSPPGGYDRAAECRLVFRGSPIYVFADAKSSGTASVHAWVTIEEIGGTVPDAQNPHLVDCTASAAGYAHCDTGLPDETTVVDNTALQQFHLRCHVQSNGSGAYRCVSGSGR